MAFLVLCLLAFVCFIDVEAQLQSNISRGSSLTPTTNSSWLSRSGLYAFCFYKQGNGFAVGILVAGVPQRTVVWTANRDGGLVSENATLLLTSDGLALQSSQGRSLVATSPVPVSSASMLDSGNFVLYNSRREIVWQSFQYPTDTLLPTQPLLTQMVLQSAMSETDQSSGPFYLIMQGDGNLVQYPVSGGPDDGWRYAYYATNTPGSGTNVSLNFDVDGRLYLLNDIGANILNLTDGGFPTRGKSYLMRIDVDGIFRLYSHDLKQNGNWSIKWQSTTNPCAPIGTCGINSYCGRMGDEADCSCLPAFGYVNPGHRALGCARNSSTGDVCKSENGNCSCFGVFWGYPKHRERGEERRRHKVL